MSGSHLPLPHLEMSRHKVRFSQHLLPRGDHPPLCELAFPKAPGCPLAEVYSPAKVCSTAQLSQSIKVRPEIRGNLVWLPLCSSRGGIAPREQIIRMCHFWNKHSCVCFSARRSDRAAARPAACSWSLAPWHGRHRGPEEAPPNRHGAPEPGRAVWRPRRCRCYNPRRGSQRRETCRSFPFGMGSAIVGRTT